MAKRRILNDFNVSGDVTSNAFVTVGGTVGDFVRGDGTLAPISGITSSSPLTTKGDLYIYSTVDTRLPVGTNGQVLVADSTMATGLKWSSGSVGNGSTVTHTQSVSATLWPFAHNLNTRYPIIQVWDSNDQEIIPLRIEVIDINNVEIEFSTSRTGVASAVAGGVSVPNTTLSGLTDTELSGTTDGYVLTYNLASNKWIASASSGGVTSVGLSVPTGLSIANSPITSSGTLALTYTAGYAIPLTSKQSQWDTAYNNVITGATFNTGDGILTLTQQDAGTVTVDLDGRYQSSVPSTGTGTVIDLSNIMGKYYNMSSANTATTYTTTGPTLGGFAVVRINATSEPTITGATKIVGSTFTASTDMHMWVQYFGVTVQYFFIEL